MGVDGKGVTRAAFSMTPVRLALVRRLVEALLVIWIAFLLARAAIAVFAPLPTPQGDRLAALSARTIETGPVVVQNPFPKQAVEAAPVIEAAPELAETALDLGLTGVWPEGDAAGSAIIRRPDGKQRRFAVGEEIVSGVTLAAVYSDQVIIEREGVREALRFESKATAEPFPRRSAPSGQAAQPAAAPKIDNRLTGADAVLNAFRLQPATDSRGAPAIAIYAGRDRAAFDAAGLQDGDLLRTINGAPPPTNPQDLAALMDQIARVGSANIVIERDGVRQALTLSLGE